MNKIYQKIKKIKGEQFAKTIRDHHSNILSIPNIVEIVRYAKKEVTTSMLDYLYNLSKEGNEEQVSVTGSWQELLDKAGYNSFLCTTKEQQDSIRPYFKKGEALCTFGTDRYKNMTVIHCVKKNVDGISYAPNGTPEREDEYGTSVISIQFRQGFISIKNRYNHTVSNCDNTFNSNPDKIIKGLSSALEKAFNIKLSRVRNDTPENHVIVDSKLIGYDREFSGVYIGESWWVNNGVLFTVNNDTQLLLDYILIDFKEKRASIVVPSIEDSVIDILNSDKYRGLPWVRGKNQAIMGYMVIGFE